MAHVIDPATPTDIETLRGQLGRVPRGVVGIGASCVCGRPTVVVTAPRLEDGRIRFPMAHFALRNADRQGGHVRPMEYRGD